MNILVADAETYFDDEFTLKKLTTEAYIRDPRFEVHGWALKRTWKNEAAYWLTHDQFKQQLPAFDWENTALLCHHSQFDGLILSHHYGVKPHAWLDTLSMARLVLGNHISVSLDSLSRHFGLAAKSVPYDLFRGKHWLQLDNATRQSVASGAIHDVELTWQIFNLLAKGFPAEEYRTIDTTIRMFTEPVLIGDTDGLGKVWNDERSRKSKLLQELGIGEGDLQSSERFAVLLRSEGIEPETKTTAAGNKAYAFAKTDRFIKELCEHENERVALLAQARLGVKSTIKQTRAERLGWMSRRG